MLFIMSMNFTERGIREIKDETRAGGEGSCQEMWLRN
jgi:uncharacterized protein with GYD domain